MTVGAVGLLLLPLNDSSARFKQEEKKLGVICQNQLNTLNEVSQGCKYEVPELITRRHWEGKSPPGGASVGHSDWAVKGRRTELAPWHSCPTCFTFLWRFRANDPEDLEQGRAGDCAGRKGAVHVVSWSLTGFFNGQTVVCKGPHASLLYIRVFRTMSFSFLTPCLPIS